MAARSSALNTAAVATGTPGLTRIPKRVGSPSGGPRRSPVPVMIRARPATHTGTSAPVACAAAITAGCSRSMPFTRASSRSAAAASDEPPPSPAATGSRFARPKAPSRAPGTRWANSRAALVTRFSAASPDAEAAGPETARLSSGPGVRATVSPVAAKATRLSMSWYPSARRPTTWSQRLTLAGARAVSIGPPFIRSASRPASVARPPPSAAVLAFRRTVADGLVLGRGRLFLFDPVRELVLDLHEVLGLGARVLGVLPLELGPEAPADLPVGVAEVIVDDRVARLQLDRLLEFAHGVLVAAEAVVGPAEAVDDHPVARRELDGAAQHLERLVDVLAVVDPRVGEVVQHLRTAARLRLRDQLKGLLQVRLGLGPLLRALVGAATIVEQGPVAAIRSADALDGLRVHLGRLGEALARAQHVAERGDHVDVVGTLVHERLEVLHGLLAAVELLEVKANLDVGARAHRRPLRDPAQDRDGLLELLQPLEDVGECDERECVVGVQVEGEPQVVDGRELVALRVAGRPEAIEHLGGSVLGRGDDGRERLAGLDLRHGVEDHRMTRQDGLESGVDLEGLVPLAPAGKQAAVGVHDAQGVALALIGRLQPALRLGAVPGELRHKPGVVIPEHRVRALALEAIHGLERLLAVAGAGVGPGAQQRGGEVRGAPLGAFHQARPRGGVLARLEIADADGEMDQPARRLLAGETLARLEGFLHRPVRQEGDEGALEEVGIARIFLQRLA